MSSLNDRVKHALEQDNTLVIERSKLNEAKGFDEQYLSFLGLSKRDMKKLESKGMAIRGYGKFEGKTYLGRGRLEFKRIWVLVADHIPTPGDTTNEAK